MKHFLVRTDSPDSDRAMRAVIDNRLNYLRQLGITIEVLPVAPAWEQEPDRDRIWEKFCEAQMKDGVSPQYLEEGRELFMHGFECAAALAEGRNLNDVRHRHREVPGEIVQNLLQAITNYCTAVEWKSHMEKPGAELKAAATEAREVLSGLRQILDLDKADMETLNQAASESKWMPLDYMRNDWMADLCAFLRNGPCKLSPTPETTHPTVMVAHITVKDPDTGGDVEIEIRKDKVTGAMVGLDGSWLEQFDEPAADPYNPGQFLDIPDDEVPAGEAWNKQETKDEAQA